MDLTTLPPNERITTLYSLQTIQQRVETFTDDWPHEDNPDQTKLKMAEAGFFYVGIGDRVQCAFCLVGIEWWDPGEIPIEEHRRYTVEADGDRYIFCPFLFGEFMPAVNTIHDVTGTCTLTLGSPERGRLVVNPGSRRPETFLDGWIFTILNRHSAAVREATFRKWPDTLKIINIPAMANAGFYCTGNNIIILIKNIFSLLIRFFLC
jgi:hypothetical protein